jgi:hypothetical protein
MTKPIIIMAGRTDMPILPETGCIVFQANQNEEFVSALRDTSNKGAIVYIYTGNLAFTGVDAIYEALKRMEPEKLHFYLPDWGTAHTALINLPTLLLQMRIHVG